MHSSTKQCDLPWLSKSLIQLMTRRNLLFSHAKRSGKRSDVEKYKRIRNRVVTQLRNAKSSYFRNLNPQSNSIKFWSAMKYLNKKHKSISVLNHGSVTANTNEEKANMLNSFFSTCFNPAFPPLSPSNVSTSNTCDISSTDDLLCTDKEVYGMLSSVVSKASGPDGVSAIMLKMTGEFIAPSVCKLFNISLQTGRVPQGWKQSIIVPVPKTSAACTPDNYRPVSLLSVLSKVLERHMYGIITNHLQKFHPLAESQWGFLPGKSTV